MINLFFAICLFSFTSDVVKTQVVTTKTSESIPNSEYFESKLKELESKYEKETHVEHFKNYKFKNKVTGKTRSWSQLSALEKQVYLLDKMEILSKTLYDLDVSWKEMVKSAPELLPLPIPLQSPFSFVPGTGLGEMKLAKKDTQKYVDSLIGIRKKLAIRHENLVESIYEEFFDSFTDEEAVNHIKELKKYHDEGELIDRSKK